MQELSMLYGNTHFGPTGNITIPADEYKTVLQKQVEAQSELTFGNGGILGTGVDNRGTIKLELYDTAAAKLAGFVRIGIYNFHGRDPIYFLETSTAAMEAGVKLGRCNAPDAPEAFAKEDSYLRVEYLLSAEKTYDFDSASNVIEIPVTLFS